jgi:hypothetical protein
LLEIDTSKTSDDLEPFGPVYAREIVAADKVCGIDRQDLVPVGSAKTEFLESDQIAKQFAARIAPAFQRAVKHDQRRSSGVACSMNLGALAATLRRSKSSAAVDGMRTF